MIVVRAAWLIMGVVALALGILGIFLPLLPTTGFLLLAAFCFARSSSALHDWLLRHPHFGPPIVNWRTHGAISRKAKRLAAVSLIAAFLLSLLFGIPAPILAVQALVLIAVAVFILSRPSPPAE